MSLGFLFQNGTLYANKSSYNVNRVRTLRLLVVTCSFWSQISGFTKPKCPLSWNMSSSKLPQFLPISPLLLSLLLTDLLREMPSPEEESKETSHDDRQYWENEQSISLTNILDPNKHGIESHSHAALGLLGIESASQGRQEETSWVRRHCSGLVGRLCKQQF